MEDATQGHTNVAVLVGNFNGMVAVYPGHDDQNTFRQGSGLLDIEKYNILFLTFDSKGFDLPLTVKMPPWEDGLKKQCSSTELLQTNSEQSV